MVPPPRGASSGLVSPEEEHEEEVEDMLRGGRRSGGLCDSSTSRGLHALGIRNERGFTWNLTTCYRYYRSVTTELSGLS